MTSKCKKSQIWPFRPWKMTFRAIQPNLSFDMWFMSPKRSLMPKKKKSYWSVSEIDPSPPQSWRTDGRTDGQTDGRTDRRTTDKSVLEKLRCLSAGGAKNWFLFFPLLYIYLLWDEVLLPWNFLSPGFDVRAPRTPQIWKKYYFFHILGLNLKHYQIASLFHMYIYRYGWEDNWKAR